MDEILKRLVATANGNGFLVDNHEPKDSSLHSVARRAKSTLDGGQIALLILLLDGAAVMLHINGAPYAAWREGSDWRIQSLAAGSERHTVADGACSCEDSRFREKRCKHVAALGALQCA